ncbi:MAG: ATP-binding protein [Candidatus Harrisonbacteria bacterium]|nr:ATP-binding protein [Candidatus Harrisonbacteria bacterium]
MPKQKETQSTQKFIDIESVREGTLVLKSGSLRKILMVSGVNFDLKSEEEQGLITYAYQNFLNSLDFSVQIFLHSRRLNIEAYIKRLESLESKEQNELLKTQISGYRDFVGSFVSQNPIMNKTFFVVVPFDPIQIPGKVFGAFKKKNSAAAQISQDKEKSFQHGLTQLNQRVDRVGSGLSGIGLQAVVLDDPALIELFYNLYNPEPVEKRELEAAREGSVTAKTITDIIAPSALEMNSNYVKLGKLLSKTIFLFTYPRYLASGWFSPLVNLADLLDISIFIHPVDTALALKNLRKKAAVIQSELAEQEQKGMVRNPMLETAFQDVESLRDSLQQGQEHLFNVGVYITIYAETLENLNKLEEQINTQLESRLIYAKPATFQQIEGINSTLPIGTDQLLIHTPLNSGPVSSFFPFVSASLTSDEGILYGINRHNNTLIIFDRFSLENANLVVFAKSGAGKSYAMKLEAIRLLMTGTDVLIVDPENEYEQLAKTVGGSYFRISLASEYHINPFDIPIIPKGEDPADVLKSHIVNLSGLLKLMLGKIKPDEEAMLDRAVSETYAAFDIVPGKDFSSAKPPLLENLQTVLENMEGGRDLAQRLYRFTKGSYAGFTNKQTNIDIKNRMIVFSIRDLEDELRPIAMYIILNFIWNLVRAELKKRVMLIDEAWWMMKYPDGASFLFGLVKRARKYFLGISTITQDVEDFVNSPYGRPIITNSSLQLLLKQSPAMIDSVTKTFNLTEAEKGLLLEAQVGQGIFFAGPNHVAIQVIASYSEDRVITTRPEQILKQE